MNDFKTIDAGLLHLRDRMRELTDENESLKREVHRLKAKVTDQVLTTHELSQMLKVHPLTLSRWRTEGTGPRFVKMGSRVIYKTSDVDEWILSNKQRSTAG